MPPTRIPPVPAPNYPALAKADRDAAYNAFLAASNVITAAEKITTPPNAKAIADQAKAKAQDVESLFDAADTAWKASLTTTAANGPRKKATLASMKRVDAERTLNESKRLLTQAQELAGAETAERDTIKEIVRQVTEIRDDIGRQYTIVQEDADKAADAHDKAGTDDTQAEINKIAAAEASIEAAYKTAERAAKSARRAKTKSAAESALTRAENAQQKVEDALLKADDAVRKVNTTARRAERAKQNTPQSTRDKIRSSAWSWLKLRGWLYVPLVLALITLAIAIPFGLPLPSWVSADWVVTAVIILAVALGIWGAKPLPEGDKHVAVPGQAFAFVLLVFCAILLVGAIRFDDGGGSGEASNEEVVDENGATIRYETVDGARYRIVETPTPDN